MIKPEFVRLKVGNISCESGIVMLTDPASVNEHWKKIYPMDLDKDKKFIVLSNLRTLEYGKDFIHEHDVVDSLGKSIEQAREEGEIQECLPSEDRTFSLRGAINTAGRIDIQGERDWTLKNPETGMPGIAVIAAPQSGEGLYPVYAILKLDKDTDKYHCIELKIEFI